MKKHLKNGLLYRQFPKIGLKMKLTTFLLIVSLFQVQANSYSQNTKLSVDLENESIENVFYAIEEISEFRFLYESGQIDLDRKISIKVNKKKISDILPIIFRGADVDYKIRGRQIILTKKGLGISIPKADTPNGFSNKNTAVQQQLSGTVTDTEGIPLPGASILEKGTTNGTQTDFDGNFSLGVSDENTVLEISYIGFIKKEVALDGQTELTVVLQEDTAKLEEVIVIGYGTATKSDLTGSVSRADLATATETSNVSIVQALQGSIAGLNVGAVTNAGQNPSLSVRGQSTLSSDGGDNAPLIVLDGIIYRGSLIDINPDDIASIDILKDVSSAAIYGSQASNGVIVVTSKTGSAISGKPTFSYSTSYTVQTPSNRFEPMNAAEYEQFYPDIFWDRGGRLAPDFLQVDPSYVWQNNFKTNEIAEGFAAGLDTPWNELLTGDGSVQTHNLSVSGKSDAASYFISGGFTDQEAYIKNDTYKRYNFRVNLDAKITDWLNIGTQTFFTVSDYSGQSANYDPTPRDGGAGQHAYYYLQPWAPIRDGEGELIPNPEGSWLNPFLALEVQDSDVRLNLSSVLYANINLPIDGLSYRANYANNYRTRDWANFDSSAASFQGAAFKEHSSTWDWTFDNILTYRKTIAENHNINATLVYGVEKRAFNSTLATARNFAVDILGYNSLEAGDPTLNGAFSGKEEESSLYQMGRLLYNYKNKYFFTGTVRRDGFSGFGINDKTAIFPSAAVGWIITQEPFADSSSWLNYLKLRASYGQSGRRGLGRYDTQSQVTAEPSVVFGDGGPTFLGLETISLANPALGWETTTGTNYAIDFGLFNSRVSGTMEYYSNKTENILFAIALPEITGFEEINSNIAQVSNYGIEATLSSTIVDKGPWRWDASFNFSKVRNKVESILGADNDNDGVEDDLIGNGLFIGEPQNVLYDYEITGMWQLADEANGSIWEGFLPGTYKLNDLNGDGMISSLADRKILGYSDPSYRFGISNTISYKNLSMSVFVNSIQGGKEYYWGDDAPHSTGNWNKADQLSYSNIPKGGWDYWMPENPNARYRRLDNAGQFEAKPYSQRSFVRLQDVSLAYTFSNELTQKFGLSNLKLFLSGKNVATWTDWNGSDPETGVGFRPDNPLLRSYTMGLNVKF